VVEDVVDSGGSGGGTHYNYGSRLRISPPRIKLAAANFARWFIGVQGRESPILGNFAFPAAQNRTNWCVASGYGIGVCG